MPFYTTSNIWSYLPFYLCSDNSGSFSGIWHPAGLAPPSALYAAASAALALVLEVICTKQRRAVESFAHNTSSWSGTKCISGTAAPWLDLMRWNIPEQSWPSFPRCECPAAASCTWSWPLSIRWCLEPHDLPFDGASAASDFLPSNAPRDIKTSRTGSTSGYSKAAFNHW